MPIDTLGGDIQRVLRNAKTFLSSKQKNPAQRQAYLKDLETTGRRLYKEIEERRTDYIAQLESDEKAEIDNQWAQLNSEPRFIQANKERQSALQIFENLRQANGGAYPKNLSPVLYVVPLIIVGVAEWYVNFATFAAVFAWASHMHGTYVKQLAEIIHPSM